MIIDLILRWLHIFGAIGLAGGVFFLAIAWAPGQRAVSSAEREARFGAFRKKWAMLVGICSLALLVSGLVNAVLNIQRYDLPGVYHGLVAVKLLLAFVLFFLAARLAGSSEGAVRMRQRMTGWTNVAAVVAVLLVGIGGYMKCLDHPPKAELVDSLSEPTSGGSSVSTEVESDDNG